MKECSRIEEGCFGGLGQKLFRHVRARRKHSFEELGIEIEATMVYKMAHAAFLIKAAESHETAVKVLRESKRFLLDNMGRNEQLTEEEEKMYCDSVIEKKGDLWFRSFLRHFYPDSECYLLAMCRFRARKGEENFLGGEDTAALEPVQ